MRRHVLRNALVPTVAVIGVQIGYLFGGIIGVEKIFNYNGMGQLMLFAAQRKDIPMLTAGVLVIGIVYMVATLIADLIIAWMNPRIRLDAGTLMTVAGTTRPGRGARAARRGVGACPGPARDARAPAPPTGLHHRRGHHHLLGGLRRARAVRGPVHARTTRSTTSTSGDNPAPPSPSTCSGRTGWAAMSSRGSLVGARDVFIVAPPAALIGVVAGTLLGLIMGFYRGRVDDVLSRIVEAFLALPVIMVALLDARRPRVVDDRRHRGRRHPVHADRRPDGPVGGAHRAPARLRDGGQAAR